MSRYVCHVADDGCNAVLVPFKRIVHLVPGPNPPAVRIFIHKFRGVPLLHFLYGLVVLSPDVAGSAAMRVVLDKRTDGRIECNDVSEGFFQVAGCTLGSGFLVEMC